MNASPLPPDSSSPSIPSPSPPFRPFSGLPTELVQHIVESTVPLSFHSGTYYVRQTTLRALSLVSRLFRQIAQPLLSDIVKIVKIHKRDTLVNLKAMDGGGSIIKVAELVVGTSGTDRFIGIDFNAVILASLRVLVIARFNAEPEGEIDVSLLASLSNLASLRLVAIQISTSARPYVLAKLSQLELLDIGTTDPLSHLFNVNSCPNLQALALYESGELAEHLETFLLGLEPQLDMLAVDTSVIDGMSPTLFAKLSSKTLFDSRIGASDAPGRYRHLRLWSLKASDPGNDPGLVLKHLRRVLESLRSATSETSARLLYLPPSVANLAVSSVEIRRVLEQLEQITVSGGTELIIEKQADNWNLDSGISQDFWRRMKELKAKRGKE